jgi:predicted nucleotidyltransferase
MTVGIDAIRSAINELAPEYGIARAYLFGSYARNEQAESSDVDLVVELNKPLGFGRGQMCLDIEARLGLPVDLIFGKEQLYPPIRQEFNREAVLIYGQ